MICKKKESKDYRLSKKEKIKEMENEITKEKRETTIQQNDPDEKIRYICEELLLNEKVSCLRNKTVLDYIQDTDFELCELFERYTNYKEYMKSNEEKIYDKIGQINVNIESLIKFKRDFDDLVEKRANLILKRYFDENVDRIKNEIKDEIFNELKIKN